MPFVLLASTSDHFTVQLENVTLTILTSPGGPDGTKREQNVPLLKHEITLKKYYLSPAFFFFSQRKSTCTRLDVFVVRGRGEKFFSPLPLPFIFGLLPILLDHKRQDGRNTVPCEFFVLKNIQPPANRMSQK